MKQSTDYRHVRGVESKTSSAVEAYLSNSVPLHWITTAGTAGPEVVNLANGTVIGERHIIMVVVRANAADALTIVPDSCPAGMANIGWTDGNAVGAAVTVIWNGACWQIASGNHRPIWQAAG